MIMHRPVTATDHDHLLPNFCNIRWVLACILMAELFRASLKTDAKLVSLASELGDLADQERKLKSQVHDSFAKPEILRKSLSGSSRNTMSWIADGRFAFRWSAQHRGSGLVVGTRRRAAGN